MKIEPIHTAEGALVLPVFPAARRETSTAAPAAATVVDLWPDIVDLAKQQGFLYRLHALLNG